MLYGRYLQESISALSHQLDLLTISNIRTQGFKYKKKSAANVLSAIRQFLYFTGYFYLAPLPASVKTVVLYLEFMARTVGYPHLKHLLSSVKYLHLALDLPFPTDSFQISTTMKGLKRKLARVPFQVLPITPAMLKAMYVHIDLENTRDLALWCAFLSAFYGLLRKASVVPENFTSDDPAYLRRHNIHVDKSQNVVLLYLGYSKTNNFCTRDVVIPIPGNSDPALDLVRNMELLFRRVTVGTECPLFSFSKRGCVTYSSFTNRLKHLLKVTGYNPELYSGHSFRRGGATFLHNCGGTILMVQASGDWSSQCFTRYLFLSEFERMKAQLLMRDRIDTGL